MDLDEDEQLRSHQRLAQVDDEAAMRVRTVRQVDTVASPCLLQTPHRLNHHRQKLRALRDAEFLNLRGKRVWSGGNQSMCLLQFNAGKCFLLRCLFYPNSESVAS